MNPADREGELGDLFIKRPETIDEEFIKLEPRSSEGRYLGRLISWAAIEENIKIELFDLLRSGLYMDEAYELQCLMLSNSMDPVYDFSPVKAWEIKWAVERRIEIDDFYDRKNIKKNE